MIQKKALANLYKSGLSMADIAKKFHVSIHKINYWMVRHSLERRSRSDAMYLKHNPHGDPFEFKRDFKNSDLFLLGLGVGLFWGEGMKLDRLGVRLGNTDPFLILYFRDFLSQICGVRMDKIKYSLQVFGDVDAKKATKFWCHSLKVKPHQLGKISIVKFQRKGTYKKKNQYGVLQIACYNKKLKAILDSLIDVLKTRSFADVAQLVEHVHGGAPSPAQILRN